MSSIIRILTHTITIPVRWYDMDAFGHVNNSVFFTYFEQARLAWWDSITPPNLSFIESGPVLINASCTFLKPIIYPETISVKMFVGPPGKSSYECFYEITSEQYPERVYAEGATKVVWVDRKLARSIPLPDYIRRHLPNP